MRQVLPSRVLFLVVLVAGLLAPGAHAGEPLVIKAATLYTAAGAPISDGMVIVDDGTIVAVGSGLAVPDGATVIEAPVVIPGLIDIHTHVGVYSVPLVEENADGNEMTDPVTPQVRALDSFNFDDPAIPVSRAAGVTTVISRPGSGNVIGGTSVAVKLKQAAPDEMVLEEICDLKMAIEGNPIGVYGDRKQAPSTLMSVYYLAEKAFVEAQEYAGKWQRYERKLAGPQSGKGRKAGQGKDDDKQPIPPKRDLGKEALVMALAGDIPVHIHCATAAEVMSSIRLAETFGLRLSLGHAYWAHLILDELEPYRERVHFNIGPPMFFSYFGDLYTFKNSPAILANAGFKVSLQTDSVGGYQQNLRHLASLCVRYGMQEQHALAAITRTAAEAVGLEQRIGSVEVGKDADLVLLDGAPFDLLSEVEAVLIDGVVEYRREKPRQHPALIEAPPASAALQLPDGLEEAATVAVRGGLIYTMAGEPIRNGVVLMADGAITGVGEDLPIPDGAVTVDASDFVVLPGLVAARSTAGLGSNWKRQRHTDESSSPIVPALEVRHAIEPQAVAFAAARAVGITTLLVTPGDHNVLGGQGAVLKSDGAVVDRMIIKNRAVMMAGLGESAKREKAMPTTRMGIAALLRETLVKAQDYQAKLDAAAGADDDKPDRDLDMEALLPVLQGQVPLLVHCERRDDIRTALRIADELKLRIILDGAADAHRLAAELAERQIPVILEDVFRGIGGGIEDQGFRSDSARVLSEAGVRIAFRPTASSTYVPGAAQPGGDLLETAAFAVKHGLSPEAALRAVTIDAATIIGVADRVGSLEPGKDADLVILRGHPFATCSVPELVLINGRPVYRRQAGERLQ